MEKDKLVDRVCEEIFEASPEPIAIIDVKENVLDFNTALQEWSGYEREELIDKNILHMPYLTRASKVKALKLLVNRQDVEPYELDFVSKSEEKKIGRITGTFLRDEENKIFAFLILITDVTELRKKMNELEKVNKTMVERELEMVELKKEIEKLERE